MALNNQFTILMYEPP